MSYGYGVLSPAQKRALKPFVARRVVHDLGSGGMLDLAHELLLLRATNVVAVDLVRPPEHFDPRIRYVRKHFRTLDEDVRTALVSWPYNQADGPLVTLLEKASTVIYLGSNFDGLACGGRELWAHLCSRRVLAHSPHRRNTLIVYGGKNIEPRAHLPEEEAALDYKRIKNYVDAYGREGNATS